MTWDIQKLSKSNDAERWVNSIMSESTRRVLNNPKLASDTWLKLGANNSAINSRLLAEWSLMNPSDSLKPAGTLPSAIPWSLDQQWSETDNIKRWIIPWSLDEIKQKV